MDIGAHFLAPDGTRRPRLMTDAAPDEKVPDLGRGNRGKVKEMLQ